LGVPLQIFDCTSLLLLLLLLLLGRGRGVESKIFKEEAERGAESTV
jgi:hypothetical protein